jgi:transcriptional regulator with XRE-family HTH domain
MVDIKKLIFDKSLSQRKIAEIIGTTQSEISHFANGRRPLLEHHLQSLIAYFGKETIDAYTIPDIPFTPHTQDATISIYDAKMVEEIKEEVKEEIMEVESIPMLPAEVSTEPEVDIRGYIEEYGSELERVNPSEMLKHADLVEKILHTSMLPTFQPDDKVFIRFIPDKAKIVDGNTYYIDSKTYPTLIRRVKFEGDNKLRLIAQNRQFGDIIMDRGDILNIGTIVGLLRMNFGNQYDEIEAVRRKKDEHLERMMDMLERKEDQQSKLIDYITKK